MQSKPGAAPAQHLLPLDNDHIQNRGGENRYSRRSGKTSLDLTRRQEIAVFVCRNNMVSVSSMSMMPCGFVGAGLVMLGRL